MKIIFAGTPDFSVPTLEALYNKGYKIELVVTQEDSRRGRGKKVRYTPVKEKALELGLEVYQPENINSSESIEKLKAIEPDFIIVVAYGQIVSQEVLDIPKKACINIHASLLPKYRGAAPLNWAVIDGEEKTGVTIMKMEKGLDTGDMYYKKAIDIEDEDTVGTIHDKLSLLGAKALLESIEDIASGKLKGEKQDDSQASYAEKVFRETGEIDWTKTGREIFNLVRGVTPWPGARTNYQDESVKIHKLSYEEVDTIGEPGEILEVSDEGLLVKVADGRVLIEELQFPNKRKMTVEDYIAGNEIIAGEILK